MSSLVKRTLAGALHHHGCPTKHKAPLTTDILCSIYNTLNGSPNYDDILFLAMLNTGFTGLLCLGEMAVNNNRDIWDF